MVDDLRVKLQRYEIEKQIMRDHKNKFNFSPCYHHVLCTGMSGHVASTIPRSI